jgi:hypothetical protein
MVIEPGVHNFNSRVEMANTQNPFPCCKQQALRGFFSCGYGFTFIFLPVFANHPTSKLVGILAIGIKG